MKKLIATMALLAISSSCLATTTLKSLDKKETLQLFSDQTMTTANLVTINNKLVHNTFTVYWDKDGTAQGRLTDKPQTGRQSDDGKWIVKNNGAKCITWQHWNHHQPICILVYKTNNSYLFINEVTHSLESMAMKDGFKPGKHLN